MAGSEGGGRGRSVHTAISCEHGDACRTLSPETLLEQSTLHLITCVRKLIQSIVSVHDLLGIQVGQVETAVSMLLHIERLALPHQPEDPILEIDCRARRASRSRQRATTRAGHNVAVFPDNPNSTPSLAPAHGHAGETRKDPQHLEQPATWTDGEERPASSEPPSAERTPPYTRNNQESPSMRSTSTTVVPFCLDTSLATFQSFVRLLRNIRTVRSSINVAKGGGEAELAADSRARPPLHTHNVDAPGAVKSKRIAAYVNVAAGRVSEIGPKNSPHRGESSPCRYAAMDGRVKEPSSALCSSSNTKRGGGFFAASPAVQLEVLRCTLKLLRINLFHFVRAAAVRRASRGDGGYGALRLHTAASVTPKDCIDADGKDRTGRENSHRSGLSAWDEIVPESAENDDKSRAEPWFLPSARRLGGSIGVESAKGVDHTEGGNCTASPKVQKTLIESLGRESPQAQPCNQAEDLCNVIEELHCELWRLLEEDTTDAFPELVEAIQATHVSTIPIDVPLQLLSPLNGLLVLKV